MLLCFVLLFLQMIYTQLIFFFFISSPVYQIAFHQEKSFKALHC